MNGAFWHDVNGYYADMVNGYMVNGNIGFGYMGNGDHGFGYMVNGDYVQDAQRADWEEGGWERQDGEDVGERVLRALRRHEDLEQGGLRAAAPAFRPPCDWTKAAMRDLMARPGWPAVRRAFGIGMTIGGLFVLLIGHSVLGVVNAGHDGEQNFKKEHLFEKCMGPVPPGPRAPLREVHGHLFVKRMASHTRSEGIGYLGPELEIAPSLARAEGYVMMTLEGGDDLSFESEDASLLGDNLQKFRNYGFGGSLDEREELIVKPSEFIGITTELRVEKPKKEVELYEPRASRVVWAKERIAGIAARIAASGIAPDSSPGSSSNSSSSGSGIASSSLASRIARIAAQIAARIAGADCAKNFVNGGERRRKSAREVMDRDMVGSGGLLHELDAEATDHLNEREKGSTDSDSGNQKYGGERRRKYARRGAEFVGSRSHARDEELNMDYNGTGFSEDFELIIKGVVKVALLCCSLLAFCAGGAGVGTPMTAHDAYLQYERCFAKQMKKKKRRLNAYFRNELAYEMRGVARGPAGRPGRGATGPLGQSFHGGVSAPMRPRWG